jgi:hypothetical protein
MPSRLEASTNHTVGRCTNICILLGSLARFARRVYGWGLQVHLLQSRAQKFKFHFLHSKRSHFGPAAQWVDQRQSGFLTVPYFHVVLTLPQEIAAIVGDQLSKSIGKRIDLLPGNILASNEHILVEGPRSKIPCG